MKKTLAILLLTSMLAALLAACVPGDTAPEVQTPQSTAAQTTVAPAQTTALPVETAEPGSSETPAWDIIKEIAPGVRALNSSTRGKSIILDGRDSAEEIIRAFIADGYYDYPIARVEGAKFDVNFLVGKKSTVTVYFFAEQREVRIAWEDAAWFDTAVLSPNAQTDTGVLQFAQVGAERVNETDNPLNGMIHIAKLADGSAFIVDGGFKNAKCAENIYKTLGKLGIAQDAEGRYIIAAWLITHAHSDHIGGALQFVESYGKKVVAERFIYHFCTDKALIGSNQAHISTFIAAIRTTYPDAKHIIPHAGMKYYIGNATISMLYVPELIYQADKSLPYYNDSSLVFRLGVGETAVFEMGDAANSACGVINRSYEPTALKSDILQITHHGLYTSADSGHSWAFLEQVYNAVDADLAIMAMHSKYTKDSRNGRFTVMGEWCGRGYQISYVMNQKDKPFSGALTQLIWDLFELRGTVDNVKVDTLYGYDGVNKVTNEEGMVTYLGGNYAAPMITIFTLDGKTVEVTENQPLYDWLG